MCTSFKGDETIHSPLNIPLVDTYMYKICISYELYLYFQKHLFPVIKIPLFALKALSQEIIGHIFSAVQTMSLSTAIRSKELGSQVHIFSSVLTGTMSFCTDHLMRNCRTRGLTFEQLRTNIIRPVMQDLEYVERSFDSHHDQ